MRGFLQPGASTSRQPLWPRWAVVLCVLLFAVMSTVQVCHTHDLLPAASSTSHGLPHPDTTPDHCPLCVAMHSAMPASLQTAPEPVLHMQALDSAAADAERLFRWRFELASRPPPADYPRM